ncbi:uncharacterized protein LOC124429931 [Vespa crabro]|uniref:uncharacterized protein LOC124429930 n=1 Tax=Vespa crabro TaxID=7445 RepID=UPI001F024BCA|nr:uncharacterized protein LOC124429930 [Vespa crabro]XP_046831770.1 uncharacterized protein LOC124429931 [Vespa crabro]
MRKTEILAKYFGQLINFPEPKHKLEFSETTENLEEDIPPNAEKIKEAIKNLKNNRGSGEYSITAEFLNWSLSKIIKELKIIFEDIWRTERFPEEWKVISNILLNKIETTLDKQLDFKKAIDSVDTETLGKAIREFGVKNKLTNLIRETFTDTISKVKFMSEISNPLEINTDVRQGDGLSPLLFNCVLEKIGRIRKIKLIEQNIPTVTLGRKNKGIEICCLAFADDIAKVSDNLSSVTTQINPLDEIPNKAGLKISVEKIKIINNIKNAPKLLSRDIEKSAVEERLRKMEIAYGITKLDKLEVLERRIMRKILGPVKTTKVWNLISNDDIYRNKEDMTETIKNGRLQFFGYIYRIDESRLSKRILMYLWEEKATTSFDSRVKEII